MSEVIYVISPSAFIKIKEITEKLKEINAIGYISTLGVSQALKEKVDIDYSLDNGVRVRAFSHKPFKIGDLPLYESEAILLAKELDAILIANDKRIEEEARRENVKVIDVNSFLNS